MTYRKDKGETMATHDLKLYDANFDRIKRGERHREYRLYDEKRRKIKPGDTIRFIRISNRDDILYATVSNVEVFSNWEECYAEYFLEDFKDYYSSVQSVVEDTYNGGYYTKEETEKFGCCCISLSNIRKTL